MIQDIIIKVINYLLPIVLGYCISVISNYKKKTNATNNALKIMLQNNESKKIKNKYILI